MPDDALTDAEGKILTTYTMDDDKDNGSLEASFAFTDDEGNVCIGSVMTNFFLYKYRLECLTPEVEVKQSDIVEIRYKLLEYKKGNWEPCPDKTITFIATNGRCTPEWTKTNAEGIATVSFSPTSTDVTEGMVEGKFKIILDPKTGFERIFDALALVTITESYKLECLTKEVEIKKGETADIRFRLMELEEGKWVTCSGVVYFTAENGTSNPEWMQADDDGLTHATFIPAADATEGTLTGSISIEINDKIKLTWADAAHITIIDDGGGGGGGESPCGDEISDKDLKKANELGLNTYMIDCKVTKLDGPDDMIEWSVTEDIEGNRFNAVNWFKEDPVYYTTAWGTIYGFPDDMYGEEIYVSEGSGMFISFGAFIDPAGGYTETNVIDFTTENIQKAVYRLCKEADGGIFAIAFVRSKDGKEGMFKVKAKPAPANSRSRVR